MKCIQLMKDTIFWAWSWSGFRNSDKNLSFSETSLDIFDVYTVGICNISNFLCSISIFIKRLRSHLGCHTLLSRSKQPQIDARIPNWTRNTQYFLFFFFMADAHLYTIFCLTHESFNITNYIQIMCDVSLWIKLGTHNTASYLNILSLL